ncbi:hypothetical protein P152DRAFT_257992 [Eremomyces bilateralis CBS 781.70]|uniref:Uncharacterized protein n=1 Tax=Eremomyces bilateralis CBS 781.70 TaxID=1392243 RepID=A0A6G1FQK0_9PEZI|nr:uncharacterized protein P152DRAFT_257992 [Eremomyces bilateralis CBS 781.70]KAF1808008.1 hypothetical protein P152DRAFT_257992 [Eremomyces bilateralis CBS 781.70]
MAQSEPVAESMGISRRPLTPEWSIELDDSFVARVIDGELRMLSMGPPVRTIWFIVWCTPEEPHTDTLNRIMDNAHPSPKERFIEVGADEDEVRYGSWYPSTVSGHHQWGLYGYTMRHGSYVQAAFLTDEESDRDWALAAWRSLRYAGPVGGNRSAGGGLG